MMLLYHEERRYRAEPVARLGLLLSDTVASHGHALKTCNEEENRYLVLNFHKCRLLQYLIGRP